VNGERAACLHNDTQTPPGIGTPMRARHAADMGRDSTALRAVWLPRCKADRAGSEKDGCHL